MSDQSRQMTPEEAAEFTEQVFNKARDGDAEMLDRLVTAGLPVNLLNLTDIPAHFRNRPP